MNISQVIAKICAILFVSLILNGCVNSLQEFRLKQIGAERPIPARSYQANPLESEVLSRVNAARQSGYKCGDHYFPPVGKLLINEELTLAAQKQARDMALGNFFSHVGIDGGGVGQRITATGYNWKICGENIAFGQNTPKQVVNGWLNSPGHCKNIMNSSFEEMGIANAKSKSRIYWVQTFGSR